MQRAERRVHLPNDAEPLAGGHSQAATSHDSEVTQRASLGTSSLSVSAVRTPRGGLVRAHFAARNPAAYATPYTYYDSVHDVWRQILQSRIGKYELNDVIQTCLEIDDVKRLKIPMFYTQILIDFQAYTSRHTDVNWNIQTEMLWYTHTH